MIIGILHKGSGLGDQLFSYIATRVRAADLGVDFGFVGIENFKGSSFMDLNFGHPFAVIYHTEEQTGKLIIDSIDNYGRTYELNKPYYDPNFNFIPDGSVIDGYGAQDIRYFEHRLDEVREWLKIKVDTLGLDETEDPDTSGRWCQINFRGGEYQTVPELFLPNEYWAKGIELIKNMKPSVKHFCINSDDTKTAKKMESLKDFSSIQAIDLNWSSMRNTKYAIISNSAFAIIPRLLKHLEDPEAITIAPRFWAGRNVGEWRRPGNYYKQFIYI